MRLWLIPLGGLAAGLVLSLVTLAVDRSSGYDLLSTDVTGNAGVAQTLLSTIITSVVTLLSVVLTVMTVAVQLAMGQFSPRIVGALLRDRVHQLAFALFGGTVVFAIVALREVDDRSGQVPGVTVLTAYLLAVASLAVLILAVAHAGDRLRPSGLIDLVGDQLHVEVDRRFPPDGHAPPPEPGILPAPGPGIVVSIDTDGLVRAAADAGCTLELTVRMGDFVAGGAPLLRVHGVEPERVAAATRLIALGDERTHDLDPAYGFRKLVDIAIRSASDDPTTTVAALHRIHDCLRQLAWRPFPSGRHCDAHGRLRLVVPVRGWGDYVRLAFEEIRLAGAGQPQIARRLRAALEDLEAVAPPERRPPLEEELELLSRAVRERYAQQRDAQLAEVADPQGLG